MMHDTSGEISADELYSSDEAETEAEGDRDRPPAARAEAPAAASELEEPPKAETNAEMLDAPATTVAEPPKAETSAEMLDAPATTVAEPARKHRSRESSDVEKASPKKLLPRCPTDASYAGKASGSQQAELDELLAKIEAMELQ